MGALRFNTYNNPWTYQSSYVFPPPALVPLFLCMFLAEHVTSQFRHLILVAPCWMEVPWLPLVLNMLEDFPQCCPVIKDPVMDVLVGQVIKGQPYLHLTLSQLKLCVAQTMIPFLDLLGSGGVTEASTMKMSQQCWTEWENWYVQEGVLKNAISAPK